MKTILFGMLSLFVLEWSNAQTPIRAEQVDKEIRHNIHTQYPTVKSFNWYKTTNGGYLVRFYYRNQLKEIKINAHNEAEIEIPESIKKDLYNYSKDINIKNVEKLKSKEYGVIYKIDADNKIFFYTEEGKRVLSICQ